MPARRDWSSSPPVGSQIVIEFRRNRRTLLVDPPRAGLDAGTRAFATGFEQLIADFGRIDCVFANSGPPPRYDSVFDMPTEHWHEFQSVALHGAFYTLREGGRHMKARAEAGEPGGSLVACGSGSLYQGLAGKMEYAASKCGAEAVIRCLAVELGEYGIRANVVAPGLIITPMMGPDQKAADDALSAIYAPSTPLRETPRRIRAPPSTERSVGR